MTKRISDNPFDYQRPIKGATWDRARIEAAYTLTPQGSVFRFYRLGLSSQFPYPKDPSAGGWRYNGRFLRFDPQDDGNLVASGLGPETQERLRAYFAHFITEAESLAARYLGTLMAASPEPRPLRTIMSSWGDVLAPANRGRVIEASLRLSEHTPGRDPGRDRTWRTYSATPDGTRFYHDIDAPTSAGFKDKADLARHLPMAEVHAAFEEPLWAFLCQAKADFAAAVADAA